MEINLINDLIALLERYGFTIIKTESAITAPVPNADEKRSTPHPNAVPGVPADYVKTPEEGGQPPQMTDLQRKKNRLANFMKNGKF